MLIVTTRIRICARTREGRGARSIGDYRHLCVESSSQVLCANRAVEFLLRRRRRRLYSAVDLFD